MAQDRPPLSAYGLPGLIDMPAAESQPDGTLSVSTAWHAGTLKNTLAFQITPRLSGSFRYSYLEGYLPGERSLYDRSFDLHYRLTDEGRFAPALAVGLRDFGGTGVFGGEYLVATRHLRPDLAVTAGIGWGRLGSHGGFSNPLGALGDRFRRRPGAGGIAETGRVAFDSFFRGEAAVFGGLAWQATPRLNLRAEYSSDAYEREAERMGFAHRSPVNLAASYRLRNGAEVGAYLLHGSEIGLTLSHAFHPAQPPAAGRGDAPPPVRARADAPADGDAGARLAAGLRAERLRLEALALDGRAATAWVGNDTYDAAPQALGRTARAMTAALPAEVQTFRIVPVERGMPLAALTLARADLEELEHAPDGSWQAYARATLADAAALPVPGREERAEGAYPALSFRLAPYLSPSLFDPDNPIRADLGLEAGAALAPVPGLVLSGALRKRLIGNRHEVTRVSNSILPHVRSDAGLYDRTADPELSWLTAEYFFRPGPGLYARLTGGYLERMYGGASAELLWKPVTGRLALGAEINYARQRDFDAGLGFRGYGIVTGHASAYYDFGGGYLGQIDAGRYLAGDWGATFSLDREFGNGFRVGAFLTLTDVSFDDFGEGSFDKGIRIAVPLSWLTGEPARRGFAATIRPVTRDGGARLEVRNRLYGMTRGYHDPELAERWGRFWR